MAIADTIRSVRESIGKAAGASSLSHGPVTLMGASKAQPEAVVREAIAAGISDFGENRVQEAAEKWPPLRSAYPQVRLHLIGPLQTNKVKQALALFDVIQTIDRVRLADEIARVRDSGFGIQEKRFFVQINTGSEPQKAGALPEDAESLIDYCKSLDIPVAGLMCVPPATQPPAPHFALLRSIALRRGLTELSMGMSDDFETAVRMGSTCVRLGRVLFGER